VLVHGEGELSAQMRRILAANGQSLPPGKATLELNVTHPLVRHMDTLGQEQGPGEEFKELALLLYDQASMAEDGQIANPPEFSRRLNSLLVRLMAGARAAEGAGAAGATDTGK